VKEETRGTSELSDESGDETKAVLRRTPENKEDDLRTALREALMSDPPRKVLIIGTMKNKKSCPSPEGVRFMDEKSLATAKTLPTSFEVLVFLTSINHKSTFKMQENIPEGVKVFSLVSGNQLRSVLKNLGYKSPVLEAITPTQQFSVPPKTPALAQPKLQQFGEKRIRATVNANPICNDLAIEQAIEFILDCINRLGGKANPKVVRDVIETLRANADTTTLAKALDADQELEECFRLLDKAVGQIKRRFREIVTERNGFKRKLFRVSD